MTPAGAYEIPSAELALWWARKQDTKAEAIRRALMVPLGDFSGYLAIVPLDGAAVACPRCHRAAALVEIRQAMPSGTWSYSCLSCAA